MKNIIYFILFVLCILGCKPGEVGEPPESKQQVFVTVYTTTWCRYCVYAKQYLERSGIKYTEKNVETKEEREGLLAFAKTVNFDVEKLNVVPIIVIGETIIVGFNTEEVSCALRIQDCVLRDLDKRFRRIGSSIAK
jgi:glutaredoxin